MKRSLRVLTVALGCLLVMGCGGSIAIQNVTPSKPTATKMTTETEVVFISGGQAILGRTPEEVEADYKQCIEMIKSSNQSAYICKPKNEVFGDRSERTAQIEDFQIDKFEQPGKGNMPSIVSFGTAQESCEKVGGRLPTEEEWEYAARGTKGRIWPWGKESPTTETANLDLIGGNPTNHVVEAGSYPTGATPEGIEDMVGNVWEWVEGALRKGGSSGTIPPFTKPSHVTRGELAGFRCIYDTTN